MGEFTSCPKCGHQTTEQAAFCQQSGGRMMSSSKARKLGWVAGIIGLAGGVSQIKHGKRNKALNNIGLTLLSVLIGVIAWEQMNKGD